MSQGDTTICIVGNLVADIELRYTQSGTPVANGRLATNPRRYDSQTNQWVDGEPVFMAFTIWKAQGENAANSLTKGTRVVVVGNLKQRSYETREGEKRTIFEVEADDIAPSLKFATAQVQRSQGGGQSQGSFGGRQQQGGGQQPRQNSGGFPPMDEDPWN